MKEINCAEIAGAVASLCVKANKLLPGDVTGAILAARDRETADLPHSVLSVIADNISAAGECDLPICQDTGMAVVFLEVGQDVHIVGGSLTDAVNEGVRKGYRDGYLRLSVVGDPLRRVNTGDNTPAVIHTEIVPGDRLKITVCPKGFGSENMSSVCMLLPSAGEDGVVSAVIDVVKKAGGNPCPPVIVGVGIGGDFELCAMLAKKALCRPIDIRNADPYYAGLENRLLTEINATGIGPQGFGGETTALGVNIEWTGTHIAGLPVGVNIGCHVNRHASAVL